ncbi:trehalose-phosphatase, partial [Streptomyces sp. UMAF16]|nr:trehalose-phosphatase [Streptomyces sp. UMAF16]
MRTDTAAPAPGAKEAVSEAWRALPGIIPDGARDRAAVLRHPASAAPALGFDGTLAGIVPDPAGAVPRPDAVRATAHR